MSITLPLPDKYIRKALYTLINGIVVNTKTINVYNERVTGRTIPEQYVLITSQSNQVDQSVKCGYRWRSSVLLDIVTRYDGFGNTGSTTLADDIAEAIRNLLETELTLEGGLNVIDQDLDFPYVPPIITENQNVFRKLIRIELSIS